MRQGGEEEWQALLRERDQALARAQHCQDQVTDSIRRRQPPSMRLMREADAAEAELAQIRARMRDFLRQLR
jgi:uncharacterized membrane-anchored protein